jgi:hypothetical protein
VFSRPLLGSGCRFAEREGYFGVEPLPFDLGKDDASRFIDGNPDACVMEPPFEVIGGDIGR